MKDFLKKIFKNNCAHNKTIMYITIELGKFTQKNHGWSILNDLVFFQVPRSPFKLGGFMLKKLFSLILVCSVILVWFGCEDSFVASKNISKAAHQFEIFRRVVFYNGITDTYILSVEGYCSVTQDSMGKLSVIIKTKDGKFLKHYLGLSDNVTYFAEQLEPLKASTAHYRVIFKPSVIVPNIDIE